MIFSIITYILANLVEGSLTSDLMFFNLEFRRKRLEFMLVVHKKNQQCVYKCYGTP